MSERASIFEKPRVGLENLSTPGTPVAATLVLRSLTIAPTPMIPRNPIKASGNMASVGMTGGKDHTEWSCDGPLTYTDSAFLFNSILGAPTSVTATGVTTLTWKPNAEAANSLRTMTFEVGSGNGSSGFAGAFLTDLSISIDKNDAKISGKGMGKTYQEGITLSTGTVDVVLEPVSSNQVSVFVGATLVSLDNPAARLKRCLSANFNMSGRQSILTTLDDTEQSYSASVERFFEKSAEIVIEQDSQGSALMGSLKRNDVIYVRYVCKGREITTGLNYQLQITFPAQIKSTSRQDSDDVYAGTYDLEPTYQTGFAGYVEVVLATAAASATQATATGVAPTGGTGVKSVETLTAYNTLPVAAS